MVGTMSKKGVAGGRWSSAVQLAAVGLLVVAVVAMPWATYRDESRNISTNFVVGPLGSLLMGLSAVSIVLTAVMLVRTSYLLNEANLVIGIAVLLTAISIALVRIADANQLSLRLNAPSQTLWGTGAEVAGLAAIAIIVTSIMGMQSSRALRLRLAVFAQGDG